MQPSDCFDPARSDDPERLCPPALGTTDKLSQASDRYLDQLVTEILAIAKPKPIRP